MSETRAQLGVFRTQKSVSLLQFGRKVREEDLSRRLGAASKTTSAEASARELFWPVIKSVLHRFTTKGTWVLSALTSSLKRTCISPITFLTSDQYQWDGTDILYRLVLGFGALGLGYVAIYVGVQYP